MNKKIIIIIGIIILIVAVAVILVMLTSVHYERIYVTPNGTSIEVPANKTKYNGNIEGAKIWNWDKGILITFNSRADNNLVRVTELGFNTLNNLIKNGEEQNIDGFTCYVVNVDKLLEIHLFDVIKVNYNGKFYCIPLSNETTHDNIIICCNDKDVAVHMARSVEYKNVYPENNGLANAFSTANNMTGKVQSKANDYINNFNLSNIESRVEEETGINFNDVRNTVEHYTGRLPI